MTKIYISQMQNQIANYERHFGELGLDNSTLSDLNALIPRALIINPFLDLVFTWSETYYRQDLFPSYLFSRRQFHAIAIFHLKSISDLASGSLPRFFGEFIYMKLKIVVS